MRQACPLAASAWRDRHAGTVALQGIKEHPCNGTPACLQAQQAGEEAAKRDQQQGRHYGPINQGATPQAELSPGGFRRRLLLDSSLSPRAAAASAVPMLAGDMDMAQRRTLQDRPPQGAASPVRMRTAAANVARNNPFVLQPAKSSPGLQKGGSSDSSSLVGLAGKHQMPVMLYVACMLLADAHKPCSLSLSLHCACSAGPLLMTASVSTGTLCGVIWFATS